MPNVHLQSLPSRERRLSQNPRCAFVRIVEKDLLSTDCIDFVLSSECPLRINNRGWMSVARLQLEDPGVLPPSEDNNFQGCFLVLRGKSPWLLAGEESIEREFSTLGIKVHSVEMLERTGWKRLLERMAKEVMHMRNCLHAGDLLPHALVDPDTGGRQYVEPILPPFEEAVAEPPTKVSAGLRSQATIQHVDRPPPGALAEGLVIPFNASLVKVRRATLDTFPPKVRDWVHTQLRNKLTAQLTHNFYQTIPLGLDQRLKYLPQKLFTRRLSKLSTVLEHICDYHQSEIDRSFYNNQQTGLHRLKMTVLLRFCRAPRMKEGFKPLDIEDVYDIRVKPQTRATTAEDRLSAMRMTSMARICLNHPELTPTEAEYFVANNPLDWKQLVKEDACRPQGPGTVARKSKRLFTHHDAKTMRPCRAELGCKACDERRCCLAPYAPPLFEITDDGGNDTQIDYWKAKAEYDAWFERGVGGPQIPWFDERSPLRGLVFVPTLLNFAGEAYPQQLRNLITDRLDTSYDVCDLLVPSSHKAAHYQGDARSWSALCRAFKSSTKRARGQASSAMAVQISWSELMVDSRRSRSFWEDDRENIPLVLLFPCRESTAVLMWLMRQAFVRSQTARKSAVWRKRVVVVYNPAASVSSVAYRTWDPNFPQPADDAARLSLRHELTLAAQRTLMAATLHSSKEEFIVYRERLDKACWSKGRGADSPLPTLLTWCVPPTNLQPTAWHHLAPRLMDPGKFKRYADPSSARTGDRWALVQPTPRDSALFGWSTHRVLNLQSETTGFNDDGSKIVGVQTAAVAQSPQDKPYALTQLRQPPYRVRPLTGSHPAEYNGHGLASGALVLGEKLTINQAVRGLLAAAERIRRGGQLHMMATDAGRIRQALANPDWRISLP